MSVLIVSAIILAVIVGGAAYIFLSREIAAASLILKDMETSFNLRYKADMRAIKRWQEATGEELTWPDHADLCVWLLERGNFNDGIEAAAKMADQHGCNTSNVLCQTLAAAIRALKKE